MSLILNAVSYRYRGATRLALEGVSLELPLNSIAIVVGANGSGKSTLLGISSGRLKPQQGTASFGTSRLDTLPPSALAERIAALPQSERVAFDFSCLDFVLFARAHKRAVFADPRPQDLDSARSALAVMEVEYLADRPVTEISGGEFQLVRLARCVAQESSLLVLDEPTAMLDPAHTLAVAQAVRRIARSGRAILIATHDLGFAASVADQAFVLRSGKLIASGLPAEALSLHSLQNAFGVPFTSREVASPLGL